jgi:hypothetical protein
LVSQVQKGEKEARQAKKPIFWRLA